MRTAAASDGVDKRREHRASVAPGEEFLFGRGPSDRVRNRRARRAVVVLAGRGQSLHRAQTVRGQLRAVRGRTQGHRRKGTCRVLRAHRHHGVCVLRRGRQIAPGAVGVPVLHARAGRRVHTERHVRGAAEMRVRRSSGPQTPARDLQGGHRQAVR